MRSRALRFLLAAAVLASWTAGCELEREQRRELQAPLGPAGALDGDPRGTNNPPEPGPQFQVRVGTGAAIASGTGMRTPPWVWRRQPQLALTVEPEPRDVHRDSLVIDTHVDTPQAMLDHDYDLLARHNIAHLDVPRMREGGLDAAFFSIWVYPDGYAGDDAYTRALSLFEAVHEAAWRSPSVVAVDRVAELRLAVSSAQTALLFGVEGGHALGSDDPETVMQRLRMFRSLGARYMTITWSNDNPLGHASTGDDPASGLTDLGRAVVGEMERIGMVVDVSHISDQTFFDIMDIARRPVLASHSSARALADHPRNMTDDMIRRVADNGGAICINYYTAYIDTDYQATMRQLREDHPEAFAPLSEADLIYTERGAAYRAVALELQPDLDVPDVGTVADHIMHVVNVGGAQSACLGSDFDGVPDLPQGLEDVSQLPALTAELQTRGVSDDDLEKILGGNVLRVLTAAEQPLPAEGAVEPEEGDGDGERDGDGDGTGLGTAEGTGGR